MSADIWIVLLTGVISGLFTYALTLFLSVIYYKVGKPFYISLLYKDIDLAGTWRGGHQNGPFRVDMILNISQVGYDLSGTFFAETIQHDGETYSNQYKITGKVTSMNILIQYEPLARTRTGVGTLLLRTVEGGRGLEGSALFIAESAGTVSHLSQVSLKRD